MSWLDKILPLLGVLLGGIITSGYSYLLARQQYKFKISEKYFDLRIEAYRFFIEYFSNLSIDTEKNILDGTTVLKSPLWNINSFKDKIVEYEKLESKYIIFVDDQTKESLQFFRKKFIKDFGKYENDKIKPNLKEYHKLTIAILKAIKTFFKQYN